MKKYANRPALRAIDISRWVNKGILKVKRVKDTTVLYLTCGQTVRQTWLKISKRGIIKKISALTYLRKGIFLTPVWQIVSDWEIAYLKENQIDLKSIGILTFKEKEPARLAFRQVEDLDHAIRQQDHILDHYLDIDFLVISLPEIISILMAQAQIIHKTTINKAGVESSRKSIENKLQSYRKNLASIVKYAPAFHKENSPEVIGRNTKLLSTVLERIAKDLSDYTFRPIGRRLGYASRSLERAIIHLQNNRLILAQERIKSALKNLKYPE